jgi:thiol-disulfide isomerase/thioredoxin
MVIALFFTGKNCPACQRAYPIIEQLKKVGYKIDIVDTSQTSELAKKYNITLIPTVIIVQDNKEIKRYVGKEITPEQLKSDLKPMPPDYKIW